LPSTFVPSGGFSRRAGALDECRHDPADQNAGEDEEADGDHESDAEREARDRGHEAPAMNRGAPEEDERSRFSSSKAVTAAFLFFGLILAAAAVFLVVLIQRAC
jgi:hypothetical protein